MDEYGPALNPLNVLQNLWRYHLKPSMLCFPHTHKPLLAYRIWPHRRTDKGRLHSVSSRNCSSPSVPNSSASSRSVSSCFNRVFAARAFSRCATGLNRCNAACIPLCRASASVGCSVAGAGTYGTRPALASHCCLSSRSRLRRIASFVTKALYMFMLRQICLLSSQLSTDSSMVVVRFGSVRCMCLLLAAAVGLFPAICMADCQMIYTMLSFISRYGSGKICHVGKRELNLHTICLTLSNLVVQYHTQLSESVRVIRRTRINRTTNSITCDVEEAAQAFLTRQHHTAVRSN